jgi:outer membrane lipoprotein-sorting protein
VIIHFSRTRFSSAAMALCAVLACGPVLAQSQPATPLPPSRPGNLPNNLNSSPAPSNAPLNLQQPAPGAPANPVATAPVPLGEKVIVEKINAYLNSFQSLQGDFSQTGADGRRYEGKLYLQRPGRLRFEYKPPATIEVVADGSSVSVRDRKLATQDLYLIAQTPLKFLTKDKIDVARDLKVLRTGQTGDVLRIVLEDKATLGGTSRITLHYDQVANALRQWIVLDPQGYETSVSVFNLDTQRRPDSKLFAIDYQRQVGNGN